MVNPSSITCNFAVWLPGFKLFKKITSFPLSGRMPACQRVSITREAAEGDRSIDRRWSVVDALQIGTVIMVPSLSVHPHSSGRLPPFASPNSRSLAFIPILPFFIMHFLRECSGHFQNGCPLRFLLQPRNIPVVWMRLEFTQPRGETERCEGNPCSLTAQFSL